MEYIESEIGYIEHNNITKKHIRYAIFYLMKTKKIKRIKCFGEDGKIDYCYTENNRIEEKFQTTSKFVISGFVRVKLEYRTLS